MVAHYDVEILTDTNRFPEVEEEWLQLLGKQRYPSYLQDPQRILLEKKTKHKKYQLKIVFLRKNGSIVSIAPFEEQYIDYPVKFGLLSLYKLKRKRIRLIGHDVICDPSEDKAGCIRKIFSSLMPEIPVFTTIDLEEIPECSQLWRVINTLDDYSISYSDVNNIVYRINMCDNHIVYLSNMKKKTRYNLKRNVRILKESCSDNMDLFICDNKENVKKYLFELDGVFKKSWQGNVLWYGKRDGEEAIKYYEGLAELGWLRGYVLYCDSKAVAFVLGVQYRSVYFYEETGYDPAYSSMSPGNVLTYMIIEDIYTDRKPRIVDFGYGENKYKKIFGNSSFPAFNVALVHKKQKFHFVVPVQILLDRAYWSIRRLLIVLGIDSSIRSLLKKRRK